MLPKGLHLYVADIIDVQRQQQTIWYVVAKTYNSALKRFLKEANRVWHIYEYYFFEADDEIVQDFEDSNDSIKAGIYET